MPVFLPLLLVLLLAGCSSNRLEPNKLVPLVNKVTIEKIWQQQAGQGLGNTYRVMSPVLSGDLIVANDAAGNIFAYDRLTGKSQWQQSLNVDTAAGLGANDKVVLAASLNGEVVQLDAINGQVVWQANVGGEILSPPQTNGAIVVVQTNDGRLVGLNANNGELLWDFSVTLPSLSLRGTAPPLLLGDNLVAGFATGKLMAFSATDGSLFWERRIARPQGRSEIERVVDIDGQPVISGSVLFTSSYNGNLSALSPTGTILWSQKTSSISSPVVTDGRVFISTADGVLRAFDAKSGTALWENSNLFLRQLSAPQNLAGFLVVADFEGYLHIVDSETGAIIARKQVAGVGVRSPMLATANTLYVLSNRGVLTAIEVHLLDPEKLKN